MKFLFRLDIPYPPSINHSHFLMRGRYRKGHTIRFTNIVKEIVLCSLITPATGPIAIRVFLYPPDRRIRDIDNSIKVLLDSLCIAGAIHDDSQVVHLEVVMCRVLRGGKCIVEAFMADESDLQARCRNGEWDIGHESVCWLIKKRGPSRRRRQLEERRCDDHLGNTYTNRKRRPKRGH